MNQSKENKNNPYKNYSTQRSLSIEGVEEKVDNNFLSGAIKVSASISSIDPAIISLDGFEFSESGIIPSEIISGSFSPQDPSSSIELFIYDIGKNIITSDYNYTSWKITKNTEVPNVPTTFINDQGLEQQEISTGSITTDVIQVNPATDSTDLGVDNGEVYTVYNFITNELGSSNENPFYLAEISGDRTEIRLKSNTIDNSAIREGYELLSSKLDSFEYFDEFYVNFYNNIYSVGINILLDDNVEEGPSILIKTFSPIPPSYNVGDLVYVVTKQSETLAWQVDFYEDFSELIENANYIKGPNINIPLQDLVNNSTTLKNKQELLNTPSSESLNSVLNVLNQKGVTITPDYSYNTFDQFVNFSSAKERINNFYEKVSQIQAYQADIDTITTTTGSNPNVSAISQSLASLQTNIANLIENFDGYESYLYYNSSSFAYPKTGSSYPYTLLPTGSTEVLEWMGSDVENSQYYGGYILSASIYDENNQNWLYYTIPGFITENSDNDNYVSFSNMVGQSFDEVWLYTKALSERYNTTNDPDSGLPLGLAAEAIKGLGFETFGNNYNNQDNFIGLTGEDNGVYVPPTGSELITKYVAINGGQIVNYWDLGYSWLNYVEQLTEPGFPYAIDKVSKEIYKRLYHNMAYLTKKKGTISGLRQLINIWGIPNTILRINEFGGKNRDNTDDYDLWYKRYSYAYTPVANSYAASSSVKVPWMPLQRNLIADNEYIVPDGVALRFKTFGHPSSSFGGSYYSQSIAVKKSNGTNDNKFDWGIGLFYEDQPSGSYSGSSFSDYYNYGKLRFYISGAASNGGVAVSDDIELPFFDGGWWSVLLQRDAHVSASEHSQSTTWTLFAANKQDNGWDGNSIGWTGSVSISSQAPEFFEGYDGGFYDGVTYDTFQPISYSLNESWNKFGTTEHDGVYVGGYISGSNVGANVLNEGSKIFSGSLQEFRYYSNDIAKTVFNDFVMNPESVEGNNITGSESSFDIVNFRAPLGNELEYVFTASSSGSYSENISSSHPAITGSAPSVITGSFIDPSTSAVTSSYEFIHFSSSTTRTFSKTNVETYFLDQPAIGIRNRISNKVQVEDGEVYGNVLSQYDSIRQNYLISESYTEDISSLEVGFSPQDEVNDDIIASFGYGVISDTIADPRFAYSGQDSYYPKLRAVANDYFKKYTEGNVWDYLRLIKYFDNSIFKAIKSYVPARTNVTTGVIVKQHMLERNRRVPVTVNPNTIIAYTPETGSIVGSETVISGQNSPISYRNLEITGSIDIDPINGGAGGVVNPYNVEATQSAWFFHNTINGLVNALPDQYINLFEVENSIGSANRNITAFFSGSGAFNGIRLAAPLKTRFQFQASPFDYLGVDESIEFLVSSSVRGVLGTDIIPSSSMTPSPTAATSSFYEMLPEEDISFWVRGLDAGGSPAPVSIKSFVTQPYTVDISDFSYTSSFLNSYVTQSYIVKDETISGSVYSIHKSQDEFYNGEFSGSTIIATTQSLLNNPFAEAQILDTSYALSVSASVGQWDYRNSQPLSTYPSFSIHMNVYTYGFSVNPDQIDNDVRNFDNDITQPLSYTDVYARGAIFLQQSEADFRNFFIKSIIFPPVMVRTPYFQGPPDYEEVGLLFGYENYTKPQGNTIPRYKFGKLNPIALPPVSASGMDGGLYTSIGALPLYQTNNIAPYFKLNISGSGFFKAGTTVNGGTPVDFDINGAAGGLKSNIVISSLLGNMEGEKIKYFPLKTLNLPAGYAPQNGVQYEIDNASTSGQKPIRLNGFLDQNVSQSFNNQTTVTMSIYLSGHDLEMATDGLLPLLTPTSSGDVYFRGSFSQGVAANDYWGWESTSLATSQEVGSGSMLIQGTTWTGSYGDSGYYSTHGLLLNARNYDSNGNIIDNTSTLVNFPNFDFTLPTVIAGSPASTDEFGLPGNKFRQNLTEVDNLISTNTPAANSTAIGYIYNPSASRLLSGSYAGSPPTLWRPTGSQPSQYFNFDPQLPPFDDFYYTPYNALINNVTGSRPNTYLQVVEYEGGSSTGSSGVPSNIIPITSGSAPKATIPDSFYTQKASTTPRYYGSKLQSANYNSFTPAGTQITYLNGLLSGSLISGSNQAIYINALNQPTSSIWEGDSPQGTMRSANTAVGTVNSHPIYFAHFKNAKENYEVWDSYTFRIDQLIECPLEDITGNKAPESPKVIKIDGSNDNLTDVRSTFEVDRNALIAYNQAKTLKSGSLETINYTSLKVGSNRIYQGGLEYNNIVTTQDSKTTFALTQSFATASWNIGLRGVSSTGFTSSNDVILGLGVGFGASTVGYDYNAVVESDADGGFLRLRGGGLMITASADVTGNVNATYQWVAGPGFGVIHSFNKRISLGLEAANFPLLDSNAGRIGIPSGSTKFDINDPTNYWRFSPSASVASNAANTNFPPAEGYGAYEDFGLPFVIEENDEIRLTWDTAPFANTPVYESADFVVTSVPSASSNNGDYVYPGFAGAVTLNSASVYDKIYLSPDPNNFNIPAYGNPAVKQINRFEIRRRVNADDRVIVYQTPPSGSEGVKTLTPSGYLIPDDFTPQQKRNVQTIINQLSAKNVFRADEDNDNKRTPIE